MSARFQIPVKRPAYVLMSSDYSRQEPSILAYVSNDRNMIQSIQEGKDIYAAVASISFGVPYESCLEFHPVTHEYQPEGAARRGEAKTIVLGRTNVFSRLGREIDAPSTRTLQYLHC